MADQVVISKPKPCDYCKQAADNAFHARGVVVNIAPAEYDARTRFGYWANMCEEHYQQFGIGKLGTGYGQRLIVKEDGQ